MKKGEIELLAPAGSWEAFVAAIENGADAVYLGGKLFSARKYASNFEIEEIAAACRYAHLLGASVYVTVNTLIDQEELEPALEFVIELYNIGVDGVIIQDMGLLHLLRKMVPQMPLHASTQMAAMNSYAVKLLNRLGLNRVVLARELSLDNIKAIHENFPQVELEAFAHGALCFSYSGQCLMSSLIGGRSGNRGACAQPCRLTYKLVDQHGKALHTDEAGEHLISPKDLLTLDILPKILAAGIASLKIEGRMKRPEYVATVVRNYRAALKRIERGNGLDFHAFPQEELELKQIFNREFTSAFMQGNPGSDYISYKRGNNRGLVLGRIQETNKTSKQVSIRLENALAIGDGIEIWVSQGGRVATTVGRILHGKESVSEAAPGQTVVIDLPKAVNKGDRVFKTHDEKLIAKAQESYSQQGGRIPANLEVYAAIGKPLIIKMEDDQGNQIEVASEFIGQLAEKRPLTADTLTAQLERMGNTMFYLGETKYHIDDQVMVPISVINQLRREGIAALENRRLQSKVRPKIVKHDIIDKFRTIEKSSKAISKGKKIPELSVAVGDESGFEAALNSGVKQIYLPLEPFRSRPYSTKQIIDLINRANKKSVKVALSLPKIIHDNQAEEVIKKVASILDSSNPCALQVANLGTIQLVKDNFKQIAIWGDYQLNVFNNQAIDFLSREGLTQITLSPELNMDQLRKIRGNSMATELLVHGSLLMMTSEHCVVGSLLGGRRTGVDCHKPCNNKAYGLQDRIKLTFPMEQDYNCRSYIYNPKKLFLLEHLHELLVLGGTIWRIDLPMARPDEVYDTIQVYQNWLALVNAGAEEQKAIAKNNKDRLSKYSAEGFTKGHYFRGVLEN